jgi:c(7)-type cytochrome triheme protein
VAMLLKSFSVLFFLCLMLMLVTPRVWADEEMLILDNPEVFAKNKRPAVVFPHEMHMQMVDCLSCHHDYVNGQNTLDADMLEETDPAIRCAACHAGNKVVNLKDAFHQQCLGCHRQMRTSGHATAPELCGECHRR